MAFFVLLHTNRRQRRYHHLCTGCCVATGSVVLGVSRAIVMEVVVENFATIEDFPWGNQCLVKCNSSEHDETVHCSSYTVILLFNGIFQYRTHACIFICPSEDLLSLIRGKL